MRTEISLRINPVVKVCHYQYYFDLSRNTASKYLRIDLAALGKAFMTYEDFYTLYNAFPDPKFTPIWREVNIPEVRSRVRKSA